MSTVKKEYRKAILGENKSDYIMLRVSPREKKEIRSAAKSVGRSMSEYLLNTHRVVVGKFQLEQ